MTQGTLRAVVVVLSLLGLPALAQDKPGAPSPPKPAAPAPSKPAVPAPSKPCAPAPSKPGAPPPPAKPAAQLEQLKLFLGNWKCSGKQFATPMFGPEHGFTGSASGRLVADGFWQEFTYEEKKSKDHPGFLLVGLWGYDSGGKRFIRSAGSSVGGWDSATSVGFNADKMVWTGDLSSPAGRMPFRQTFTKKSEKEWSSRFELNTQGNWVPLSEVTCTAGKK
jgi:hypothetical protein